MAPDNRVHTALLGTTLVISFVCLLLTFKMYANNDRLVYQAKELASLKASISQLKPSLSECKRPIVVKVDNSDVKAAANEVKKELMPLFLEIKNRLLQLKSGK